jgi:murein DD-endopeptidase MepM/ murein hydrolase activator NlpD
VIALTVGEPKMIVKALRAFRPVVLLVLAIGVIEAGAQVRPPINIPIEMDVPIPPTPVEGDGKIHLVYELHLTNFSTNDLTLTRVEVLGHDATPLAQYESTELNGRLARPGLPPANKEKQRLGGGMRAVVYIWLTLDAPSGVPSSLSHRVTAILSAPPGASSGGDAPAKTEPTEVKGEGAQIKVHSDSPLVISPPLRGGEWLAANGPSNISGHRRALIPVGGKARISQRFAIDWVQLRPDGKTWINDRLKNENYRCYGVEALAVADGMVVAVKDGIPQNVPGATSRAVTITLETIGGNHVILDLGQGRYAFYAHLQPGSLRVKVGDQVRRGQVLGLVGNSGNSTEPHLHFHISDANSPLGSEGLPYVLESFERQGQGGGWKPAGKDAVVERRVREIPLENAVVRFP